MSICSLFHYRILIPLENQPVHAVLRERLSGYWALLLSTYVHTKHSIVVVYVRMLSLSTCSHAFSRQQNKEVEYNVCALAFHFPSCMLSLRIPAWNYKTPLGQSVFPQLKWNCYETVV